MQFTAGAVLVSFHHKREPMVCCLLTAKETRYLLGNPFPHLTVRARKMGKGQLSVSWSAMSS